MRLALTAYERMREEYQIRPEAMPFEWYLERHLEHGFIFSRPDIFVVCRPVISTALKEQINACDYQFDWDACDCWCIAMLAGNMAKAWDFMPWFLPLMCFQRALDGTHDLRFYKTEKLQRLTLSPQYLNSYTYASA